MIVYAPVNVDEIIDLRHAILRADLPREEAMFAGDDEPDTAHFAASDNGLIVGCVTVMRRVYDQQDAWQIRGMAVLESYRGKGVGAELLQRVMQYVRSANSTGCLWCNAREPAAPFYQKQGFEIVSERFHIPMAGPHYRMMRQVV